MDADAGPPHWHPHADAPGYSSEHAHAGGDARHDHPDRGYGLSHVDTERDPQPDRGDLDPDPLGYAKWDADPGGQPQPDASDAGSTTIRFDAVADGQYECRVYDPAGRLCFTLVGTLHLDTGRAVRPDAHDAEALTSFDFRGRGVLPVRADTYPSYANANDVPVPHLEPLTLSNHVPPLAIAVSAPDEHGPLSYTVTHRHGHTHAGADPDELPHAHDHAHTGADAHRAGQYGHARDPHQHPH
jgi:hypothetical protein